MSFAGVALVSKDKPFLIVGVGASAGGVEALERFFSSLGPAPGMAIVVVLHSRRDHESALASVLGRYTPMPVKPAQEGATVAVDTVYICPPGSLLSIQGKALHLEARDDGSSPKSIDHLFASLAEDAAENAAGVLLSGCGHDGTLGIKAIKEKDGFTFAQGSDGSVPQYSGMPDSAIAGGGVDLVLPVESIAKRLLSVAQQLASDAAFEDEKDSERVRLEICRTLANQTGHDFSGYKEKTFMRRVRRRMQVIQLTHLADYLSRLQSEPAEVISLFRDLLIGVTAFFRDREAFEILAQDIIPKIFENKHAGDQVRIWVPGCATGEEAYSIAILVREFMDTLRASPKVQIFATDIDDGALSVARVGRYSANQVHALTPRRRSRFFAGDDATFTVGKDIRDMCMFSTHSVLRDPPFSRIDLISCRNLLIYFGSDFQAKAIPVFHFALRPDGYLFLGTSENVAQHSDLFSVVDRKHRIFQRRNHVATPLTFPGFVPQGRLPSPEQRGEPTVAASALRRAVEMRVLERYAPAHVVINRDGDVLHYSARTGKYLEAPAGFPNRQLIAMARGGLRLEVRAALREAVETRRPARRENIPVEIDDRVQLIDLVIEPLGDTESDPTFLVLFTDIGEPRPPHFAGERTSDNADANALIERLETQLRDTRERLQGAIEEHETALEELKSSNEELQSMNEELQSTNEELETSKEELQSLNEELQTVNAELQSKVDEVDRAHMDLRNVFESTQIATVFLDRNLAIRNFTPAVTSIFNLISSDRGRPLTDIVSHLDYAGDFKRDIQSVLENGTTVERRLRHTGNLAPYLMRILPYRTANNVIDGVSITFVDVSKMIRMPE